MLTLLDFPLASSCTGTSSMAVTLQTMPRRRLDCGSSQRSWFPTRAARTPGSTSKRNHRASQLPNDPTLHRDHVFAQTDCFFAQPNCCRLGHVVILTVLVETVEHLWNIKKNHVSNMMFLYPIKLVKGLNVEVFFLFFEDMENRTCLCKMT